MDFGLAHKAPVLLRTQKSEPAADKLPHITGSKPLDKENLPVKKVPTAKEKLSPCTEPQCLRTSPRKRKLKQISENQV